MPESGKNTRPAARVEWLLFLHWPGVVNQMLLSGNSPVDGDVLITSADGRHLLRVMPNPDRIMFAHLADAVEVAKQHADNANTRIWRVADGETTLVTITDYLRLTRDRHRNGALFRRARPTSNV